MRVLIPRSNTTAHADRNCPDARGRRLLRVDRADYDQDPTYARTHRCTTEVCRRAGIGPAGAAR